MTKQPQLPNHAATELHTLYTTKQKLTYDRLAYALRQAGWTLEAIAGATGITREGVRQRLNKLPATKQAFLPAVPYPPRREKPRKVRKPQPRSHVTAHMRALVPVAQRARRSAKPTPEQEASRELTAIFAALREQNVSVSDIARAAGVSSGAVELRLRRFGYLEQYPSQATPSAGPKPVAQTCKQGHPLSGENLRIVSGNGPSAGARICRTCERRRSDAYRDKRKATA